MKIDLNFKKLLKINEYIICYTKEDIEKFFSLFPEKQNYLSEELIELKEHYFKILKERSSFALLYRKPNRFRSRSIGWVKDYKSFFENHKEYKEYENKS